VSVVSFVGVLAGSGKMEKTSNSENEKLKNDLKILKTYARKISSANKIFIRIFDSVHQWIQPTTEKIDYESITDEIGEEFIRKIDEMKDQLNQNENRIRTLHEENEGMKNALLIERQSTFNLSQILDEQTSLLTKLKEEICTSVNGISISDVF
jgi:ubiquitin C-terminal hydrolase